MFDQYRWYYNAILTVVYNHYGHLEIAKPKKYFFTKIRDLFRKYEYQEEDIGNMVFKEFVYMGENHNSTTVPQWWKGEVHSRLPRGAIAKFVSSINSAISNYKNGNTTHFTMKYRTKKSTNDILHFEDKAFPSFIKEFKGGYWYTTRDRKRKTISFAELARSGKGLEVIYEKTSDKYYIHYPVDRDWYAEDDRRNDNQEKVVSSKADRIISLDPGVRKFMVGYDPLGTVDYIGEGAHRRLMSLLLLIDGSSKTKASKIWRKVKNLVSELHNKTAYYLVSNYDDILLPDFRISGMVTKKKISRPTKRLLYMFSFHSFKEKLINKCKQYGKNLYIVDESYTSCTCGMCGYINNMKGKEIYNCERCKLCIDRDALGSRNILIKNLTVR
jgi:putative transposase